MNMKKVTLTALAATALLSTAPAFADGNRGDRQFNRGGHFQNQFRGERFQGRAVFVNDHGSRYYGQRRVIVQQPVVVHRPVAVYRDYRSHDLLGSLILGTVIGVAIANHAGY